ncbi:class I tRNA ligase family protein, partial [Candidatus Parcubacteria bacterium]|nr:class I tRNA ligase family protein [Candidatus Parcubacteria bacterium]
MPEDKGLTRSQREGKILQFWKENRIFEKTLAKESPKGDFVFYEGPPTANGRPATHHLEARAFKDAIPRYKTMQGFKVPRKAGWDTHGLPVELEVEKTLGFKSKKDIEEYGIAEFNKKCKESVGVYIDEWARFTDRIGYWVNLDEAYYTYENSYIESVWKIVAHVEERKLLYKDYKVLPWCPRCGTALSSHELAQGYQDVKDLSLYVKFRITGEQENQKSSGRSAQPDFPIFLVAWTTTPWTLPGNLALAVGEDIDYVKIKLGEECFILAEARLSVVEGEYEIVEKMKGKDLVGLTYEPLYTFVTPNEKTYKIYAADFVTTEDGTGIVHTAVMYGQEDFELGTKVGLPKQHLVSADGTFMKGTDWLEGRSVVDEQLAVDILKDLQTRGLLFKKENHLHSYPFCWRCKTRLIYYARDSWYIRMSALRDELMAENEKINWEPDYIKEGRFGEWLREVKDWAISRERYWGTPLPVWVTGQAPDQERIIVDSIDTLKKYAKKSDNKYFVMRHGGTEGNKNEIVSYAKQVDDHLTEEGRKQAEGCGKDLKDKKIDLIISSPFVRTKETAEIVAEEIGLTKSEIIYDERLKEINPGDFDGKNWNDYHNTIYKAGKDWFVRAMSGGEALADVRRRVGECLYEIEKKYKGKNILFVTHGGPAWLLFVLSGEFAPENKEYKVPDLGVKETKIFTHEFKRFENAEVRPLNFAPLPHDENFATDLHRPYIDEIVLEKDGPL